jgi:hypothetical protein
MNKERAKLIVAVKLTVLEDQVKAIISFCDPEVTIVQCKPRNRYDVKGKVTHLTLEQMQPNGKIRHNLSRIGTHLYMVSRYMGAAFNFKADSNDEWLDDSEEVQLQKEALWKQQRPPYKGRTVNAQ